MQNGRHFTLSVPMHQCGIVCADGVELFGLAAATLVSGDPSTVIVCVPGQYDNAYQQRTSHSLAASASDAGIASVLANTRGRDSFGYQRQYQNGRVLDSYQWALLGSSFERVAEAGYDLAAWLSFVDDLAPAARVVLVGHSHGAIKIANYWIDGDRERRAGQIAGMVLLSPSDDIGDQRASLGDRYDKALAWASERIERGEAGRARAGLGLHLSNVGGHLLRGLWPWLAAEDLCLPRSRRRDTRQRRVDLAPADPGPLRLR